MDDEPLSTPEHHDEPVPRVALEHELTYLEMRLHQAMLLQGAVTGILVIVAGVVLFLIDHRSRDWHIGWLTLGGFVAVAGALLMLAHRIPVRTARCLEGEVLTLRTILSAEDGDPEPNR